METKTYLILDATKHEMDLKFLTCIRDEKMIMGKPKHHSMDVIIEIEEIVEDIINNDTKYPKEDSIDWESLSQKRAVKFRWYADVRKYAEELCDLMREKKSDLLMIRNYYKEIDKREDFELGSHCKVYE